MAYQDFNMDNHWLTFTPNRSFKKDPRVFVAADGMYFTTHDGKKVIDGISSMWCTGAGHNRKPINDAVKRQVDTLDYATAFQATNDKAAQRDLAEQDMLMREVDDAVRQDRLETAGRKYGLIMGAAVLLGLLGFGGYLIWQEQRSSGMEERTENLVTAFDELEAGNLANADGELEGIAADTADGPQAIAKLTRAGIALQQGRRDEAVALYDEVANDGSMAQPFRNLAAIRSVAANFDQLEPAAIVERLGNLATPGNPWFGSAGELVAMAHLRQNREDLAGPLFAAIAKDENAPRSLRSRTRQMAGLLGVDAIEDVEQTLAQIREDDGAPAATE